MRIAKDVYTEDNGARGKSQHDNDEAMSKASLMLRLQWRTLYKNTRNSALQ